MMNDVISLIPVDEGIEKGNITRETQEKKARSVYGRAYSVGEREFYDATQAGYELESKFEVWVWDYQGEQLLEWQGTRYRVVRKYQNREHRTVELTCERMKGRRS